MGLTVELKFGASGVIALAGLAGLGLVGYWVWKKGGITNALGGALDGAVSNVVGSIGSTVGLPTPSETTTEAEVARWIIDNIGHFEASKWASAGAFLKAEMMPAGSGKPPAADTPAGREFLPRVASYDETARLLQRYPTNTGPESVYTGGGLTVAEEFGLPM